METSAKFNPAHNVEATLAIISGKWKALIVWYLVEGSRRYGVLRRLLPDAPERVFIRQLRELEADGIILRKDFQTMPLQVEYSLSDKGRSLLPLLGLLCEWGRLHGQDEE